MVKTMKQKLAKFENPEKKLNGPPSSEYNFAAPMNFCKFPTKFKDFPVKITCSGQKMNMGKTGFFLPGYFFIIMNKIRNLATTAL